MKFKILKWKRNLKSARHVDIKTVSILCSERRVISPNGFLFAPPVTRFLISVSLFRLELLTDTLNTLRESTMSRGSPLTWILFLTNGGFLLLSDLFTYESIREREPRPRRSSKGGRNTWGPILWVSAKLTTGGLTATRVKSITVNGKNGAKRLK